MFEALAPCWACATLQQSESNAAMIVIDPPPASRSYYQAARGMNLAEAWFADARQETAMKLTTLTAIAVAGLLPWLLPSQAWPAPRAESAQECGVAADMAVVARSLAEEQIQPPK